MSWRMTVQCIVRLSRHMGLLQGSQDGMGNGPSDLAGLQVGERRRRRVALGFSALIHIGVIAALCWPAAPQVLAPRLVAHGEGGNAAAAASIALYLPSELRAAQPRTKAERPLILPSPKPQAEKPKEARVQKPSNALEVKEPSGTRTPGSPMGTSYAGLTSGDEIKPALPSIFPDLQIHRDELPTGLQGDVIVEVTIDPSGMVVEERLLQGMGHGIDERVIAVLHDWRFRPATRNGVPISSKHDVRFHFPS